VRGERAPFIDSVNEVRRKIDFKDIRNVKSNTFVPMSPSDYDIIRTLKAAKDARKKSG